MPLSPSQNTAANQSNTATYAPFTLINGHTTIDADGVLFDAHRVFKCIKCNKNLNDEAVKHQILKHLNIALLKVKKYGTAAAEFIDGLMQYRLLAPA